MHYRSPYPPLPPLPEVNAQDFIYTSRGIPDSVDTPQFFEPVAGKRWTRREVREWIYDAATALHTPLSEGGFGLAHEGEIVALMSTNSAVSIHIPFPHGDV